MPFFLIFTLLLTIYITTILNKDRNKNFNEIYKEEINNTKTTNTFPKEFIFEKKLIDYSFISSDKKSINMFIDNLNNMKNNKIVIPNENLKNSDLKTLYGINTLETLTIYENNYYEYIYALNALSNALINNNLFEEAIEVLNEAIYCKSNISNTYVLYITAMKNLHSNYNVNDMMKNKNVKDILEQNIKIKKKIESL